jgi:hypothetical protein
MKSNNKFFFVLLAIMAAILVAIGFWGTQLEEILSPGIVKNLPDVLMFAAVGVMLWNHKIRDDEKKAEAALKKEQDEAAAAAAAALAEAKKEESEPDAPN